MGNLVRKTRCPKCAEAGADNAGDNLAIYDNDTAYCFACTHWENNGDTAYAAPKVAQGQIPFNETGVFTDLSHRRISKEVCQFFSYQTGTAHGKPVHIANYYDEDDNLVAQKIRGAGKRFHITGDGSKMRLFGQDKFTPNPNLFITVVEGEIDALSVTEMLGKKYPVVSIPKGVNDARTSLKANLNYLSGFKHVVLAFDNDDHGRKAAKDCIDIFEPGKVKLARWELKDANEHLTQGKIKEVMSILFNAEGLRPDKILSPSDLLSRILEKPTMGVNWPWKMLTKMTYGMRPQQLIVVGAGTGIGKTEVVKDIISHMVFKQEQVCGVFSFEQDPADTVRRMIGSMLGKRIHEPGCDFNEAEVEEAANSLQGKVYLYDNFGAVSAEDLAPKMRYLAKACNAKLFIIDNLSSLAARIDGNERQGIDKAMELIASITRELRCTIILVSHLSRDKSGGHKAWGEGRIPVLENFRGSGGIESWSDVVLGLSRNADSEDPIERNMLFVKCLKTRYGSNMRGAGFYLRYNPDKSLLEEV